MKLYLALIPACFLITHVAAQDKCRIEGKVINTVTGQPISKAWVMLTADRAGVNAPIQSRQFSAAVDSSGAFQFDGLAAGAYRLSAHRNGFDFEPSASGQTDDITLAPGARKIDVILRLLPLGVISGRITTDDGDPVRNVRVSLITYRWDSNGAMPLERGSAETNDLGEYRIYDVNPGKYYLRAAPRVSSSSPMGLSGDTLASEFYPGTFDRASAVQIEIRAGDQVRGTDIVLRRFRGGVIRGRVLAPPGFPSTARISVAARPISSDGWVEANLWTTANDQGNFQITAIPPGLYTLRARASLDQKEYYAGTSLQVGSSDIDGVFLRLTPPMDVSGVVRIEGAPNLRPSLMRVYLSSAIPLLGGSQATAGEDGAFTLRDLSAIAYKVMVNAGREPGTATPTSPLPQLYVKSVRCGNTVAGDAVVDFSNGAPCDLSIIVSANTGKIDGTVALDSSGSSGPLWVTIAPDGRSRQYPRAQAVKVEASGAFQISGIPPGFYRLFAWTAASVDVDTATYDPDFTKPFETQGQSVQVAEGSTQSVTLRVVRIER